MSDNQIPKRGLLFSKARGDGVGMDPKSILIGDRLRHTVYNGALLVPGTSLRLIEKRLITPHEEDDRTIELPSVDSVKRPTLSNSSISVTYLREEKYVTPPSEEGGQPIMTKRTVATNQIWNRAGLLPGTDRLRGGGEDEEIEPNALCTAVNQNSGERASTKLNPTIASGVGIPVANNGSGGSHAVPDAIVNNEDKSQIKSEAGQASEVKGNAIPPNTTASIPGSSGKVEVIQPSVSATVVPQPPTMTLSEVATKHAPPLKATNATNVPDTGITTAAPNEKNSPAVQTSSQVSGVGTQSNPSQVASSTAQPTKTISSSSSATSSTTTTAPQMTAQPVTKIGSTSSSPPVVGLAEVPPPQYNQHIPGPNDEMQVEIKNSRPNWYRSNDVSELERSILPEWFDKSAQHRTKETYLKAREHILKMSNQLGNRFITTALIRRTISGDVGSLNRLFQFLVSYSLINADAINDSTPTTAALRPGKKRPLASKFQTQLATIVVKKQKTDQFIDWQNVADEIGDDVSASDCRNEFLSTNFDEARSFPTGDPSVNPVSSTNSSEGIAASELKQILSNVDESILQTTIDAALSQSQSLEQARQASVAAVLASAAAKKGQAEELALSQILAQLNEKRMQRLEKRIELLDDIEGMMEAERMALELERRDFYTARCRQWFGGGS